MKQISIEEAKALIDRGNLNIVDIRDEGSFEEAHIEKAVLVNDGNIENFIAETDKKRPLLCYCFHGMTSQSAAQYFEENGFETVYSMEGGFEGWREVYPSVPSNS